MRYERPRTGSRVCPRRTSRDAPGSMVPDRPCGCPARQILVLTIFPSWLSRRLQPRQRGPCSLSRNSAFFCSRKETTFSYRAITAKLAEAGLIHHHRIPGMTRNRGKPFQRDRAPSSSLSIIASEQARYRFIHHEFRGAPIVKVVLEERHQPFAQFPRLPVPLPDISTAHRQGSPPLPARWSGDCPRKTFSGRFLRCRTWIT